MISLMTLLNVLHVLIPYSQYLMVFVIVLPILHYVRLKKLSFGPSSVRN